MWQQDIGSETENGDESDQDIHRSGMHPFCLVKASDDSSTKSS